MLLRGGGWWCLSGLLRLPGRFWATSEIRRGSDRLTRLWRLEMILWLCLFVLFRLMYRLSFSVSGGHWYGLGYGLGWKLRWELLSVSGCGVQLLRLWVMSVLLRWREHFMASTISGAVHVWMSCLRLCV